MRLLLDKCQEADQMLHMGQAREALEATLQTHRVSPQALKLSTLESPLVL
jgi:hypothetical protein